MKKIVMFVGALCSLVSFSANAKDVSLSEARAIFQEWAKGNQKDFGPNCKYVNWIAQESVKQNPRLKNLSAQEKQACVALVKSTTGAYCRYQLKVVESALTSLSQENVKDVSSRLESASPEFIGRGLLMSLRRDFQRSEIFSTSAIQEAVKSSSCEALKGNVEKLQARMEEENSQIRKAMEEDSLIAVETLESKVSSSSSTATSSSSTASDGAQ
ncbi:MAG: hypothetical protein ACAH59_04015 [Pseudobdellovibrionaceae bacterium]